MVENDRFLFSYVENGLSVTSGSEREGEQGGAGPEGRFPTIFRRSGQYFLQIYKMRRFCVVWKRFDFVLLLWCPFCFRKNQLNFCKKDNLEKKSDLFFSESRI